MLDFSCVLEGEMGGVQFRVQSSLEISKDGSKTPRSDAFRMALGAASGYLYSYCEGQGSTDRQTDGQLTFHLWTTLLLCFGHQSLIIYLHLSPGPVLSCSLQSYISPAAMEETLTT